MMIKGFKGMLLILCIASCIPIVGQSVAKSYPVIGEPIPEFRLANVRNHSKNTFDPREVKGKWIIMDFWHKNCVGCIQSFPKVNKLQREFKDEIQFLLVGNNDRKYNSNIEQVYEQYKRRFGLDLAAAFDTMLIEQFGVREYPHVIVIDPQSVVYAITSSKFLTSENLRDLVNNRNPSFIRTYGYFEQNDSSYNKVLRDRWNYLVNGNEQRDFIYRSVLSRSDERMQTGSGRIDQDADRGFYQITRVKLSNLYNIAYLGEMQWSRTSSLYKDYWASPVLEIRDSSDFQYDYGRNTGLYNYSLVVPQQKASKDYLMEVMQRDLKSFFGYDVSFETRMVPYWRLTATEEARDKLRTKSDVLIDKRDPTGMDCKRIPVVLVLAHIEKYNGKESIRFFDETNISGRIDIKFNAVMTDMEDVRRALKKQGLILELAEKEMKALVIRDPSLRQ